MSQCLQIFISCVSREFKSYREALRTDLDRPNVMVKVQEQFIPTGTETLDKLDDYIRACDVVIHLLGDMTGAFAQESAVAAIKARYPDLHVQLPPLRDSLEFGKPRLSYTQWEAYLAAYHKKILLIAVPEAGAQRDASFESDNVQLASQKAHLERLSVLGRYPEIMFSNADRLSIQVLRSKLHDILATLPGIELAQHRRARFGKDQFDELKNLLLNEAAALRNEGFIFTAFTQITGSIGVHHDSGRKIDPVLIERLAERESVHELLMLAYLCKARAESLGIEVLQTRLNSWLSSALRACNLTLEQVKGHDCCQDALDSLDVLKPPVPYVEIAWKSAPADPQHKVFPEGYIRWGRCRERLAKSEATALAAEEVVTAVLERVEKSRQYREVPLARVDVFATRDELNRPWEYRHGFNLDDDPELHPWPTVVRITRNEWERRNLTSPPIRLGRNDVACLIGDCTLFLQSTQTRGVFFAAWCNCGAIDLGVLSQAVSRAGIGFWLRSLVPLASADRILDELDGLPLAELPHHVHAKRRTAQKDSEWRDMSVLYDPPDLPSFEFSDDSYDMQDELRTLTALT